MLVSAVSFYLGAPLFSSYFLIFDLILLSRILGLSGVKLTEEKLTLLQQRQDTIGFIFYDCDIETV